MPQNPMSNLGGQYARRIKVYGVSPRELQQMSSGGAYLIWTFFGLALGAALTALGALLSGTAFQPVTLLILTALAISGGFLAILTLILAVREQSRTGAVIREIRRDPERLLADVGVVMHLSERDGTPVEAAPPSMEPDEEAPLAPGRRRAAPPA